MVGGLCDLLVEGPVGGMHYLVQDGSWPLSPWHCPPHLCLAHLPGVTSHEYVDHLQIFCWVPHSWAGHTQNASNAIIIRVTHLGRHFQYAKFFATVSYTWSHLILTITLRDRRCFKLSYHEIKRTHRKLYKNKSYSSTNNHKQTHMWYHSGQETERGQPPDQSPLLTLQITTLPFLQR